MTRTCAWNIPPPRRATVGGAGAADKALVPSRRAGTLPRHPTMIRPLALALGLLAVPALGKPPRLTLFITVDALGSDLLLRTRGQFKGGLATLLDKGAFYPDVRFEQAFVATAPGHSVLSTGAYPWRTGVIGNRVLNRSTGKDEPIF